MFALLLTTLAHALPPDAEPGRLAVAGGRLEALAVSDDGAFVVGRQATTQDGIVVSVEDWSVRRVEECAVAGVAAVDRPDDEDEIWVGCTDGSVRLKRLTGGALVDVKGSDGDPVRVDLGTSIRGLWWHGGTVPGVYAVSMSGDFARVHVIDPDTLEVDGGYLAGYPVSLQTWSGFHEAVISGDRLVVHHAEDHVTTVFLGANPNVAPNTSVSLVFDPTDVAPALSQGGVYAVDPDGRLAEYLPSTLVWQQLLSGLEAPRGVGASLDPLDAWLLVAGSRVTVYELTGLGALDPSPVWTSALDASRDVRDVVVSEGYAFGGGNGLLHIFTTRPWVYPDRLSVTPEALTEGDVATLTFAASAAGDYEIRRGGTRLGGGRRLASGTIPSDRVGDDIVVELPVDGGDWAEGENPLYVVVTDSRGQRGHARTTVSVDTPPDPPKLTDDNLAFSDGALVLSFAGIPDADLDRYEIYVTTTPFDPDDWPTGGPPWDGTTKLTTPIVVRKGPGEAVQQRIEPLENDVKHYIAVRAIDRGGLVGPLSRVISEVPRPSFSASDLAGEDGGAPCSTSPVPAGLLAVAAAAAAALRRRRAALVAVALAAGVCASGEAQAGDDDDPTLLTPEEARRAEREERKKERWRDQTPVRGNAELRYGFIDIDDPAIDQVFDDGPHDILLGEFGPQIWKVLELDFGFGFLQDIDEKIDASGVESGEKTMLTWFPLSLDATFRLQAFDEQPIVPHARFGFDYVLWSEKEDDGHGGKATTRGAKTGNHVALGVGLLLDVLDRRRASLLEAQTGVNDTYLIVEWRRQFVDGRERPWDPPKADGFDFSGDSVTAGLKIDF